MTDYTGIALVVTSILGPLVAIFTLFINNRKVDKVHAVTEEVLRTATATEHAVNGKAPGEASISQQVETSAKDITTILDKQERDVPTPTTEDVDNGNGASIRKQLTHLTQMVETLGKVVDPPQPSTKSKRGEP